jgi:outer membrane protein
MILIRFPRLFVVTCAATAGLLFLPAAANAQAQIKIATVDLRKVFEGYYKTKQADAQLRERGSEAEKQFNGMLDDYKKANEDYKKLVESANDQAVSSEEREKRKKSAEGKVLELNEIEKSLRQFKAEKQATFDDQKKRMRDAIVREIREIIDKRARSGNFTFVIDSSALTMNFEPILLYTSGQNDLTEEILKQMNLAAPPELLSGDNQDKSTRGDLKLNIPDPDKEKDKPSKKR